MRHTVAVTVVSAGLISLGCAGLFGPRELHDLRVESDTCGNYTVTIDAEASGRALELWVDGAKTETFRVDGRQIFTWLSSGAPGSTHEVVARFSSRNQKVAQVTVAPLSDAVTLALEEERAFASNGDALLLSVSEDCADGAAPSWEVTVEGNTRAGQMLPSSRTVRIPLADGLVRGPHTAYSRVVLSPFATESDALQFIVEPPCSDYDDDGLSTGVIHDPVTGACDRWSPVIDRE